uniref:RING-type domain-containing protein n=1 Tax=Parastrongyloides trichosuri TaxID=131310 RepID=A0A0N4ZG62_PARTI
MSVPSVFNCQLICCSDFDKDQLVVNTKCGHLFHSTCLYKWIQIKKNCPKCSIVTTMNDIIRVYYEDTLNNQFSKYYKDKYMNLLEEIQYDKSNYPLLIDDLNEKIYGNKLEELESRIQCQEEIIDRLKQHREVNVKQIQHIKEKAAKKYSDFVFQYDTMKNSFQVKINQQSEEIYNLKKDNIILEREIKSLKTENERLKYINNLSRSQLSLYKEYDGS